MIYTLNSWFCSYASFARSTASFPEVVQSAVISISRSILLTLIQVCASSSTTSALAPFSSGTGSRFTISPDVSHSSIIVNSVPFPVSLSTWIVPPIMSTMFLVIAIPRPVPPIPFSVTVCSLEKESNTCFRNSLDIPIPLSFTLKTTVMYPSLLHDFSETRMLIIPPTGVNFTALLQILRRTCVRRSLSVMISSWITSCVSI